MTTAPSVLRLKITLNHTAPPIWRRIEIASDATYWDLHVAIQDAMGWEDDHLHEFAGTDADGTRLRIGVPDHSGWGDPVLPGWERELASDFRKTGDEATCTDDFGDGWEHLVALESVESAPAEATFPRCTSGRRACPPEDCGGPLGRRTPAHHSRRSIA